MLPVDMLKPVLVAGTLLGVMSIVDTLAYGVRTAGVLTKRLAISLSLFNILVVFSRLSNMFSAPVLGNLPDKVEQGVYQDHEVLVALRVTLLFVVLGVVVGALLTPGFIKVFRRGIEIMEEKGSLPPTLAHGFKRIGHFPDYFIAPRIHHFADNLSFKGLPVKFLLFNIFVTCFYSIGVLSTVLAASWNHDVSSTAILLSGIVNGVATMLLFLIVDPPASVVIDGCINGKRPQEHAYSMNLYLVLTRLMGTILALLMLPLMGQYVQFAAEWVNDAFGKGQPTLVAESTVIHNDLRLNLKVMEDQSETIDIQLTVKNTGSKAIEFDGSASDNAVHFEVIGIEPLVDEEVKLADTNEVEINHIEPGKVCSATYSLEKNAFSQINDSDLLLRSQILINEVVRTVQVVIKP